MFSLQISILDIKPDQLHDGGALVCILHFDEAICFTAKECVGNSEDA
jgi:hypothetical protein